MLFVFQNGYEKLGIDSLDPFTVPSFTFRYKQGTLMLGVMMRNATTRGLTSGQIKSVRSRVSDSRMSMEIEVYFPQIVTEAHYKGQGKINELRVTSKGFVNVTYSKFKYNILLSLQNLLNHNKN